MTPALTVIALLLGLTFAALAAALTEHLLVRRRVRQAQRHARARGGYINRRLP